MSVKYNYLDLRCDSVNEYIDNDRQEVIITNEQPTMPLSAATTLNESSSLSSSSSSSSVAVSSEGRYTDYEPYRKIYGHLHYPKTGGTTINSMMASKYERVCGNKGNSYDHYAHQQRLFKNENTTTITKTSTTTTTNLTTTRKKNSLLITSVQDDVMSSASEKQHKHRGRIQWYVLEETGFEDCEYISIESEASSWKNIVTKLNSYNDNENDNDNNVTLELHVPCRTDPIDLLYSIANHRDKQFKCDDLYTNSTTIVTENDNDDDNDSSSSNNYNNSKNNNNSNDNNDQIILGTRIRINKLFIQRRVNNVWFYSKQSERRFDDTLLNTPNIDVKCFNPFPIENYVDGYMKHKLQPRRYATPVDKFVQLESNKRQRPSKQEECVWAQPKEILDYIRQYLIETKPYLSYCNRCMGTSDQLV